MIWVPVITKTGNEHKRAQTGTNEPKTPANDYRLPEKNPKNNCERPQTVTPAHQMKKLKMFLLPAPGNYKNHVIGLVGKVSKKNQLFFWFHLSTKETVFWYLRHLISVGISYFNFLHSSANTTRVLLSISWGLDTVDKQVECSLIETFRMFKLWSFGRLFLKKTLGISNSSIKSNYFLCTMTVRVIESLP